MGSPRAAVSPIATRRCRGPILGVKALGVDDVLVLRTRGRRSGQVREVLVAYVELDHRPVVCGANGGSDRDPAWFANLVSGRLVEIERRGCLEAVVPVVLDGDERDRALAAAHRAFPHVRLYLAHTTRHFPLVRLEPLGADGELGEPGPGQTDITATRRGGRCALGIGPTPTRWPAGGRRRSAGSHRAEPTWVCTALGRAVSSRGASSSQCRSQATSTGAGSRRRSAGREAAVRSGRCWDWSTGGRRVGRARVDPGPSALLGAPGAG